MLSFPLLISPFYRQVSQVLGVVPEVEGGINEGNLAKNDVILAIKKQGAGDEDYVSLNNDDGRTLSDILNNKTRLITSIGDNLTFSIYTPSNDSYSEKNVILGPRYFIGIEYEYISNTELQITRIYSEDEGGNNFDKNLDLDLIIIEIDGVPINQTGGFTLEKALLKFPLNTINLSTDSATFILAVDVIGVKIGIYSNTYFMHKNDFAKFFTSFWPEFWYREIIWLFIIAFSITLFNMLPLPVFDGDRIVKELINWGFGEEYKTTRKKTDKVRFKKDERDVNLSEYRVEKVDNVKIIIEEKSGVREQSEIILSEDKYNLIDKIGDGFKDTVVLNLPEQTKLEEGSLIEISYEYWHDEKRKVKNSILNIIRYFTLFIIVGNFILSIVKFGDSLFWI